MSIKLYQDQGCLCEWEELPNEVSGNSVKGYTKVSECDACKAQRETDAKTTADQRAQEAEAQALVDKRKKALDTLADAEILDNPSAYAGKIE